MRPLLRCGASRRRERSSRSPDLSPLAPASRAPIPPAKRANSIGSLDKVSRVRVVEPDDLLDSLREENEALLVRVAHLEATRDESRRQMEGLLTSSSWRMTAPLRSFAASVRHAPRRIRQLPERLAPRPVPTAS